MRKRYLAIWFPQLMLDWAMRQHPVRAHSPFALVSSERGKIKIQAANALARSKGVHRGMSLADSRALCPDLDILDYPWEKQDSMIKAWASWAIRYTPITAIDPPEGILLDISGCAHLWGGEEAYLDTLLCRIRSLGYQVRGAIADTIGAAWALSRFGSSGAMVHSPDQKEVLTALPVEALRIEASLRQRLHQLGVYCIHHLERLSRPALRRRLGTEGILRLDQLWGDQWETLNPYRPDIPYQERLSFVDPLATFRGMLRALETLLDRLTRRLEGENRGMRKVCLRCYRVDDRVQQTSVSLSSPSRDPHQVLALFKERLPEIRWGLGIELMVLEASVVDRLYPSATSLWAPKETGVPEALSPLLDRIRNRIGEESLKRYLPTGRHWPEKSFRPAASLEEGPCWPWPANLPRPIQIQDPPLPIEVSVLLPDSPPFLFRLQGRGVAVSRAEGPERIASEWWRDDSGVYRDYYAVEDPQGIRYWLFRLEGGDAPGASWFLHGWFA